MRDKQINKDNLAPYWIILKIIGQTFDACLTGQDELPRTLNRHDPQRAALLSTLRLHPGADESQRVAGQLATRAGDGPAAEQHQDAGVGRVFAVVGQPQVLQALEGRRRPSRPLTTRDLDQW